MSRAIHLSQQQRAVLALTAQGAREPDIAAALGIGVQTVKNYRDRAYVKLGAINAAHAVYLAVSRGAIAPEAAG